MPVRGSDHRFSFSPINWQLPEAQTIFTCVFSVNGACPERYSTVVAGTTTSGVEGVGAEAAGAAGAGTASGATSFSSAFKEAENKNKEEIKATWINFFIVWGI